MCFFSHEFFLCRIKLTCPTEWNMIQNLRSRGYFQTSAQGPLKSKWESGEMEVERCGAWICSGLKSIPGIGLCKVIFLQEGKCAKEKRSFSCTEQKARPENAMLIGCQFIHFQARAGYFSYYSPLIGMNIVLCRRNEVDDCHQVHLCTVCKSLVQRDFSLRKVCAYVYALSGRHHSTLMLQIISNLQGFCK